ncbi:MAG: Uma2 family endonuclease [Pseudomonadota bacterium]|nr:Uma2 family endonuclease [Pseudomonadota bacterium]
MSTQTRRRFTPEEYLTLERQSETKSEYFAGEIFAMVGAREPHNLIVTNCVRELSTQLKDRPCRVYSNDMRVKVDATGLYTYPDVVVMCGEPRFDDNRRDTLLNPVAIIEVLSESTEAYDRGKKFGHYRKLEGLAEYLLIAQDKPHVEHYVRQPDGQWLFSEADGLDGVVLLPSIECRLALAEVYHKVETG